MQTNILEYLEQTVMRVPDKVAFANESMGLTFRETYNQALAIGSFLSGEGLYRQPVVVFMKKHPTTLVSFFGTIYAGCYYVPLDDEMPHHRVDLILRTLNPSAMICDEDTASLVQNFAYNGKVYLYNEICNTPVNKDALSAIRDRQIDTDPIYIVFTSGSTGVPKGVTACHRSVLDYVQTAPRTIMTNFKRRKVEEKSSFGIAKDAIAVSATTMTTMVLTSEASTAA